MTNTTNDTTLQDQLDRTDADSHQFDWGDDTDSVVFHSTEAVAVYISGNGDIVIRQQAAWYDNEDDQIVIPASHAAKVAQAITDCLEQLHDFPPPKTSAPRQAAPPRSRSGNAERQQRYRDRKRNAEGNAQTVTRNAASAPHRNGQPPI